MNKEDTKVLKIQIQEKIDSIQVYKQELDLNNEMLKTIKELQASINSCINENYHVIIETNKIEIETVDFSMGVIKNVLSISLTGFIAILGLPFFTKTPVLINTVFILFVISIILLFMLLYKRGELKNKLIKNHLPLIDLNLDSVKENLEVINSLKDDIKSKLEFIREKTKKDQEEIKNILDKFELTKNE